MLFGQNFSRRHQRDLPARFQRLQCGQRSDNRLAGANITLNQPQHGFGLGQVAQHLVSYSGLGTGQWKAQLLQKSFGQGAFGLHNGRAMLAHLRAQPEHGQLVCHQLLKRQPVLSPMTTIL